MMTNPELIKALRWCASEKICTSEVNCGYLDKGFFCTDSLMLDAADALEAAEEIGICKDEKIAYCVAAIYELEDSNDAYIKENERLKKRIAELEAHSPKWTMLKDEMPKPHTKVLVSGIEAINNSRVYKVMVNDNGTLRPTDYAPSIRWDYWMPFGIPHCGTRMRGEDK